MSAVKLSLIAIASIVSLASVGCTVREQRVYSPPPTAAYEGGAYADANADYQDAPPADETVVVNQAPPPPQAEDPGPPPGGGYVWVGGRWGYSQRGWVWHGGRWAPGHSGHAWVAGHWQRRHRGWVWVRGHWA